MEFTQKYCFQFTVLLHMVFLGNLGISLSLPMIYILLNLEPSFVVLFSQTVLCLSCNTVYSSLSWLSRWPGASGESSLWFLFGHSRKCTRRPWWPPRMGLHPSGMFYHARSPLPFWCSPNHINVLLSQIC